MAITLVQPTAGKLVMNHECELYIKKDTQYIGIANVTKHSDTNTPNVIEWKAQENHGAKSHLIAGNDEQIAIEGKRTIGDAGNDELCKLYRAKGMAANRDFAYLDAEGRVMLFNATVSITNIGASDGDMDEVAIFSATLLINGEPTFDTATQP